MLKIPTIVLVAVTLLMPTVSHAAINNLNGLNGNTQIFSTSTAPNSPHLLVQSGGTTHTFKWDGTPWLLKQGGTGATSFSTSSIPFIHNGVFSENSLQLFWDAMNTILNVGGTTTPSAKLSIRGSGSLGLLNVASSSGSSLFYISGAGNIGVGNTTPQHKVDVSGAIYSRLVTDVGASSVTVDWNSGNVHTLMLNTSNTTLAFANGKAGGEYKLILKQDGTGGRAVTWPSSVKWPGGISPTITSISNSTDLTSFVYDGTDYLGSYGLNYATQSNSTIARDNHAVFDSGTATSTYTSSFTISGSQNVVLFVGYAGGGGIGTDNIQSITWNGVSMQRDQYQFGGTDNVDAAVYHLAGASSGTHNITITLNSADRITLYVSAYTGVEQMIGALATSTKAHNGASGGNSINTSLNPSQNSWEFSVGAFWNADFTSASGSHFVLDNPGNGVSRSFDSNGPLSSGSKSFGAFYAGISGASLAAVTFAPAP